MRIGVDVRCFAQGKNTGVEEYTKNILLNIFEYDKENKYILFFNAWKGNDVDFSWTKKYKNVLVKRYFIPNKLLNFCLWFFQYPKLDRLCDDVDIFFMPNSNFCAVNKKVKLYVTVHDLSFVHYKNSFSFKRKIWHFFVNPRLLIQKAYHIFAVSEATKEDVRITYGIKESKITVTKNGLSSIDKRINRNSIDVIKVKEKYKLPYQFILYFGTIEPRKNIINIIRAYDELRTRFEQLTHKLVIAGADGWREEIIDRAIEEAKFNKDIIVIKNIPEEEKGALYILSSVFLYPSFFEGFGFPPLEAMNYNVPIITSYTTSLPEIVGKNAIMIDPMRIDELVNSLYEVLSDKTLRDLLTKHSQQHIQNFNWQKTSILCVERFKTSV
jgi:glycosyltransferase involved in cell wall biosynthesis